jgi:hypothetical protein
MPAPQLHLTFGETLAAQPELAEELRRAGAHEPQYLRLGSIFHDLPYYGNMALMAIRYGLRRPAEESYWGTKVHYDRPDQFLARFVETARTVEAPLERPERLALVLGFCSHAGLDLAMHPLVNYLARRDALAEGGAESHHHRLTEKYQALYYHIDSRGTDLIGSREMRDKTRVTKRSPLTGRIEPAIVEFATTAFRRMWCDAPSARMWSGWVRSFAHFGIMVSGPMALRNSLKLRTPANRKRYFQDEAFDFYDFWAAGRARGIEIGNLAYEYFERADFSDMAHARFVAQLAFDGTLAEPFGLRGPSLPDIGQPGAPSLHREREAA